MSSHWPDPLHLFHALPHALHDLLQHEDKTLIDSGASGIVRKATDPTAVIGIEKSIDPAMDRTQHNFDLLVRDYLRMMPEYTPSCEHSQKLVEHWRKILAEQPHRLAQAHLESWPHEHSRHFWQQHLHHHANINDAASADVASALEHWEELVGNNRLPLAMQAAMKHKQWEELVMRQRLHLLDLDNMGIKR